jgi:hypothetical protein
VLTGMDSVDLQARAAAELDGLALAACEYTDARRLMGLVLKRCGICAQCERYSRLLVRLDWLRWLYHRIPKEQR